MDPLQASILGDDRVVKIELKIAQQNRIDGRSTVRGLPTATVKVTIQSGVTSLKECFSLPNCGEVDVARAAASVFVIGWIREIRRAMRVADIEITADSANISTASVKLAIRMQDYQDEARTKDQTPSVSLTNVTVSSDAESLAIQEFRQILDAAYQECEEQARLALFDTYSRFAKFVSRWLDDAKEELSTKP
jgi:hypothetical protein